MKYFPLVWATLWRRKTRTILTLLSIVVAFLLFGVLRTVDYAFTHPGVGASGADKLITSSKYSLTISLPIADTQRIQSVPGVASVTWFTWFGGYYREQKNFVFALPVDIDSYLDLHKYDPYVIDAAQLQAYRNTRTGALLDADLAKKYGWKVGDKIPIHSTIWNRSDGSLDWTFDVVGTFLPKDPALRNQLATALLFHYDYFDEGRTFGKGTVGWFEERINNPTKSAEISQKIDALFANSANETKTSPASDFALSFIKQQGNITFILRMVILAVFFTLLFLTGNTMMQSVRERVPELAVLKTLGYSGDLLLMLVLAESLILCMIAASAGLGLAFLLLPMVRDALQGALMTPSAMLPGFAYAVALALVVGLLPALRALRLDVVDALAEHR